MGRNSLRISVGLVCCAACVLYLDTFCVCPCCGYTCHAASHANSASGWALCCSHNTHAASNSDSAYRLVPMALHCSVTGPHIQPAMQTWPEAWQYIMYKVRECMGLGCDRATPAGLYLCIGFCMSALENRV